jgi:hypothetical protein
MKNKGNKDKLATINDVALLGSAIVAIGLSLLDFVGVLDQIPWLTRGCPV